jgi:tagatose-1,6-bisphosphate aldolase
MTGRRTRGRFRLLGQRRDRRERLVSIADISDADGLIRVLAIDHRDSLRQFMRPAAPDSLTAHEITSLKIELVRALAPFASGVMLEPEYSIPAIPESGALPLGVGFTAALEDQGYLADPSARPTRILPGWSVHQARLSGAAAVKLLLPYHPDAHLAAAQHEVARAVAASALAEGIALVLEPLAYGIEDPTEHVEVVVRTARTFASFGASLLKLPFPGGGKAPADVARAACAAVTDAIDVPWAVLSGGGTFDSFAGQLAVACDEGCRGFMVGRALWGEAVLAGPDERASLLAGSVAVRLQRLGDIVRGTR